MDSGRLLFLALYPRISRYVCLKITNCFACLLYNSTGIMNISLNIGVIGVAMCDTSETLHLVSKYCVVMIRYSIVL